MYEESVKCCSNVFPDARLEYAWATQLRTRTLPLETGPLGNGRRCRVDRLIAAMITFCHRTYARNPSPLAGLK